MKKVFSILSVVLFFQNAAAVSDNNGTANSSTTDSRILNQEDLPSFLDLMSIIENPYVQDNVRLLLYQVLELIRTASKTPTARGSKQDINDTKRRVGYLSSLEISLEEAQNLDKIKRLLGLNKDGLADIKRVEAIAEAVHNADELSKIGSIPEINVQALQTVNEYENLKQKVQQASTIQAIKEIPYMNSTGVKDIEVLEQLSNKLEQMKDIDQLLADSSISQELKAKISELVGVVQELKQSNSLSKLSQVPYVNNALILKTREELTRYARLKKENAALRREKSAVDLQLKSIEEDNAKLQKFHTRLISVLLRALIGFDYRASSFNFAEAKGLKIPDRAAIMAASKTSFSHLGGSEEDLYLITNGIQSILKILLTEARWIDHLKVIKSQLDKIKTVSDKLNDDGALIKLNIIYAADIVESLSNGARHPTRDNVQNFSSTPIQTPA